MMSVGLCFMGSHFEPVTEFKAMAQDQYFLIKQISLKVRDFLVVKKYKTPHMILF